MNDLFKKLSDASFVFGNKKKLNPKIKNINLGSSYKMNFEFNLDGAFHIVTKNKIKFYYSDLWSYVQDSNGNTIYYTINDKNKNIYLNYDVENFFKNNSSYKLLYASLFLYKQNLLEHQKDFGFKIKRISFLEASKPDVKQYNPVSFLLYLKQTI